MLWASIVTNELVGTFMVWYVVKISSATINYFLVNVFFLGFMSSVSHFVKILHSCRIMHLHILIEHLAFLGFKEEKFMLFPSNSNSIADGKQFTSKQKLWQAIEIVSRFVDAEINKMNHVQIILKVFFSNNRKSDFFLLWFNEYIF